MNEMDVNSRCDTKNNPITNVDKLHYYYNVPTGDQDNYMYDSAIFGKLEEIVIISF